MEKSYSLFIHKFSTSCSQIDFYLPMAFLDQSASEIHISVLLCEAIEWLNISDSKRHIDATLGMGGHTEGMLKVNSSLKILGFDQDPLAREKALERLSIHSSQIEIIPQNFETIGDYSSFKPTSILFDLGVSSLHFDMPERGFSFRFEAPLDMRMNPEDSLTAGEIINTYSCEQIETIFREYGEEPHARLLARKIIEQRDKTPFTSTIEFAEFIESVKPWKKTAGGRKKQGGGHPAALVFQALRIEVNRELEVLETALKSAIDILEPGGRLAVISFHSLEDRFVKQFFKKNASSGKKQKYPSQNSLHISEKKLENHQSIENTHTIRILTKKPIEATSEELNLNPRARSAKMRVIEKI